MARARGALRAQWGTVGECDAWCPGGQQSHVMWQYELGLGTPVLKEQVKINILALLFTKALCT